MKTDAKDVEIDIEADVDTTVEEAVAGRMEDVDDSM